MNSKENTEMTKKLILPVLALLFATLCTTTSSAQTCSGFSGANVQYMGVGSSAQFNTFAFAAEALITAETGTNNVVNFWAGTLPLLDNRSATTDSAKTWVAWDNASDCTVYAYFSVDSTIGVKSFFAYQKETNGFATNYDTAAVFVQPGATVSSCSAGTVTFAGQPACTGNLPSTLSSFFEAQPAPSCSTSCTGNERKIPLPYCGQHGTTATTAKWCFFNAGHADIRPEDTLYATTRALSAYNSTNGLAGLGYDGACGSQTTKIGCPIYESFGQKGVFNVLSFALTGNDPISGAAVPGYTSLNVGAVPVVVFVNDSDASGFGAGAPSYSVTNINRKVLAGYYDGTFSCTGDISPALGAGPGNPVQVIQREVLSGTYNTFEFTGVRTLTGSASVAVPESKVSATTWFTQDDSGQELNNNPATNFNTAGCPATGATVPTSTCGDPLYLTTGACGANGNGLKLRAIGTGEMVKATLCAEGTQLGHGSACITPATGVNTPDGLGYAFWGYGNFAPAAGGCQTVGSTDGITCGTYYGHYLTVDGIDPLFTTPGGALDSTPNPNGAYHLPQCFLTSGTPDCFQIPFTHVKDGSYPLWTILRVVTFSNVSGASGQTTPASVVAMVAEAEKAANNANTTVTNLSDFVPYFTNINAGDTTGDLNLGVLRVHYKQTNNPNNGFTNCSGGLTGLSLTPAAGACTVDVGGDVGGSVITVQSDLDFNADFAGVGTDPKELYGTHN
jgi:hypothetical protein